MPFYINFLLNFDSIGVVFFVYSLLPELIFAQNKVVVIPLLSDGGNAIPTVTSAGQVWMDRNLGAFRVAESVDDYQAYGWWYQWGRLADGHEMPHSPTTTTLSASNVPGHGDFITPSSSPYDWRSPQNDGLWHPLTGFNNPCPAGFRVPTRTEWDTERTSSSSNNSEGAFASPFKLVVAGYRSHSDGSVSASSISGYYWSSTVDSSNARFLVFFSDRADMTSFGPRAYGYSVRCIKN